MLDGNADFLLMCGLMVCLCISFLMTPSVFESDSLGMDLKYVQSNIIKQTTRSAEEIFNIQPNISSISQPVESVKQLRQVSEVEVVKETKSDRYQCSDGSFGVLNDDYCDCNNGEDEPLTSACSHLHRMFQCHTDSLQIYSSRVNDGVNDCPDGSDESITHIAQY